jgi:dipeptidyl aminopeptidase/acylaminoacyl peptidase
MAKNIAPYGSWPSPITSSLLIASSVSLSQIAVTSEGIYWAEGRPLESGRVVVVRDSIDITPQGFNVRTRVHEYGGGGAFVTHAGSVYFCNYTDQRIYRQDSGASPRPITPEPPAAGSIRYADLRVSPNGETIVCIRERHEPETEATNELVVLPLNGMSEPRIIVSGHDFYSSPRFNSDGTALLWLSWDHPNMPWDGTELWVADVGSSHSLARVRKIAGGPSESIFQPEWNPDGSITFISDRTGWWNLYSDKGPLAPMDAEFGAAQWVFGMSRYGFLNNGRLACIYSRSGLDYLAILNVATGILETLTLPYTSYSDLVADGDSVFVIAASATIPAQVVKLDARDGSTCVLKSSSETRRDPEDISVPEPIEYATRGGQSAHALYYAPANRTTRGPAEQKPPLLVMSHGGPTAATTSGFRLSLQYWTSRGFAVVDVNYGGSTGYGREYRERLYGKWGIVDVEDCIEAARYLAERGDIDSRRMAIRGGSAGGYTTLCALVFHDVFAAGASYYGVADLAALARDTHKFESRYTDRLVASYPEGAAIYRERSPLFFADRVSCPVILFQGLEDKIVPPNQAETFVAALRAKGLPHAYLIFPTEGHGFRQSENIQRAAEAELYFYSRVFGFALADEIEPVAIANIPS